MQKRLVRVIFTLAIIVTSSPLSAQKIPQPEGWVNDYANVISKDNRDKINAVIEESEDRTSAEIAVVTVHSISPYDEIEYARLVFDGWRPGKKGKDNGILVLVAIKERRWRIEVGYGLEGILPDGLCGEIGRNYMVPYFKDGRYGEGIYNGITAIARVISGEKRTSYAAPGPIYVILFVTVIFLIILIEVGRRSESDYYYGSGWHRRGGGFGGGFGGGGFGGGGFGGFGGGFGGGGGAGGRF